MLIPITPKPTHMLPIDKIQNLIDQKRNELGNVQSVSSSENYLEDLEIL